MEIEELKEEISYLKKRVENLEKIENRRKSLKYLRIIVKVIIFLLIIFMIWKGYDYLVNGLPNMLNDKIQSFNPFKFG